MAQIDIEIEDDKKFGTVAFLVDRDDFLEDLAGLRERWVPDGLISYKRYYDWYSGKFHNPPQPLLKKHQEERAKYQNKYSFKVGEGVPAQAKKELERVYRILPQWDFHFDILHLASKYHRPEFFVRIIIVAVVCGKVTEKDYKSVHIETTPSGVYAGIPPVSLAYPPLLEFSLRFTPWTTITEISKEFASFKKKGSSFEYYEKVWGKILNPDTISNIKRDREWYWLNLPTKKGGGGKSYHQIAKEETKDTTFDLSMYEDKVRKGIKQYSTNLKLLEA